MILMPVFSIKSHHLPSREIKKILGDLTIREIQNDVQIQ
jgi:hypothetical protein